MARPRKIVQFEQPVQPIREEKSEDLTTPAISSNLCAGCGRELNERHITNEKGSYHGVECYNKVN